VVRVLNAADVFWDSSVRVVNVREVEQKYNERAIGAPLTTKLSEHIITNLLSSDVHVWL